MMAEDREIKKAWFVVENGEIIGIKFKVWDEMLKRYVYIFLSLKFTPDMMISLFPKTKEGGDIE